MTSPALLDARTSIVVVTYQSADTISACLNSALANLADGDEIWVVDNASSDATVPRIKEIKSDRIRLIQNKENFGFSRACNQAIAQIENPFVLLLNPDVILSAGSLSKLLFPMTHPRVAAVGPVTDHAGNVQLLSNHLPNLQGDFSVDGISDLLTSTYGNETLPTQLLTGFCCLWRRSVLEELEGLDEAMFCGADDLDLSWRASLQGYKLLVARGAFVHHAGQHSFKQIGAKAKDYTLDANDALLEKLVGYYGADRVPSQSDLWGISWVQTRKPWPERTEQKCLSIGYDAATDEFHALCDGKEVFRVSAESGNLDLDALGVDSDWDSIKLVAVLDHLDQPGFLLTQVLERLAEFGRLTLRWTHWLAPSAWLGTNLKHLVSPFTLETLCTQELVPGYRLQLLDPVQIGLSEYGSQLHFNQGVPQPNLEHYPRAIEWIERTFVKIPGTAWKSGGAKLNPRVTLMLAVYKRQALSGRQIDALFGQTEPNVEVFVVGDGCPDHAKRLQDPLYKAKVAAAKSFGLKVHTHNAEKNTGTSATVINYAIKHARAPYFMFTGDDDWISPDHVENYLQSIEGTPYGLVLHDSKLVGGFYTNDRVSRLEPSQVGHSELIVATDWARRMPAHDHTPYHDWEFIQNLVNAGVSVGKSNRGHKTYWVNLARTERHYQVSA